MLCRTTIDKFTFSLLADPILIEFQRPSYTVSEAMPSVTIAVDVSGLPPIVVEISFSLSTVDVSAEGSIIL